MSVKLTSYWFKISPTFSPFLTVSLNTDKVSMLILYRYVAGVSSAISVSIFFWLLFLLGEKEIKIVRKG